MKTIEDALRDGCEAVGIQHTVPADGWQCYIVGDTTEHWMGPCHPALPAYVASLLVERAWTVPGFYYEALFALKPYAPSIDDIQWSGLATTNFRILAALVALGHWSIEEAREVQKQ